MSSILKALEKAEESHSVRRDGGPGGFKKSRERRRPWIIPAAVLGGAAFAALATFAAMGGFSRPATPVAAVDAVTAPAQTVIAAPNQQLIEPLVENPAQPASADAPPEGADVQVASEAVPVPPPVPVPASKSEMDAVAKRVTGGGGRVVRATAVRPAVASAAPAPAQAARQKAAQAPREPVALQPAAAQQVAAQKMAAAAAVHTAVVAEAAEPAKPSKARPDIRVTGIAWQKGSSSNGAIVNGRMLEQGSVIDGYKVEQILEDKVVFSGSGGKLEVPLSAGQ